MNYYSLIPSLQHTACIKVAIALWSQDDVEAGLYKDSYCTWSQDDIGTLTGDYDFTFLNANERQIKWLQVEEKVTKKVKELPLPDLLRKKVLSLIKPIGFEILRWSIYHQRFCLGRDFLNKLCWTSQGRVDRKKTAEALVRDENLGIRKRYRLACVYCLKDDILTLWNKMSESDKKAFYSKDRIDLEEDKIVVFWTYNLKRNVTRIECMGGLGNYRCTPLQYAFEYAAVYGNKVATEYFWQHLNCEEREKSLSYFVRNLTGSRSINPSHFEEDYAGVLFFLLSQMNEEQQLGVFKEYPYYVLESLLKWPWQDFFMETVKHMWAFLRYNDFCFILEVIINKVTVGLKDYNYQNVFTEFWQKSPITHKKYVIYECTYYRPLLCSLFHMKDKENIKIILDSVTVLDREMLIFSHKGKIICENLINDAEMDLLEFFIKECISSKDVMIKFREEFEKYIICCLSNDLLEEEEKDWIYIRNKMFQLLNDLIQKYDKSRCVEEGYNGLVKRLCS